MSKAFTKETDPDDDDDAVGAAPLPAGGKNYITPAGHARLRAELLHLLDVERPRVVEVVHWAASNGDRSENGDYLYGKKRLREIDRRIRFLGKRLEIAVVVDPALQHGSDQVFFGASVVFARADASQTRVTILGIDEADPSQGQISWVAPVAQALLKARVGDEVRLRTPSGWELLEVIAVSYPAAAAAGAAPAPPPACA
ncbi:transcription elongation factor GreB [Serpentinimonas barnesii]|uniref:transcription elongation factor GreB n=1 Tax=Serpentinimonas barnesii TaxID=1458427 RepID=UPI0005EFD6C1|nr:transcription elongation factor GreB [Serpentinimonas barnesii]